MLAAPAQESAPPTEATFVADLAAIRDLVDDERFKEAKTRLLALLEQHRDQEHVRLRRSEILEELLRCAVRLAVPRPDPQKLVSGKIVKYSKATGDIEVTYKPDQMGDFEKSLSAEPAPGKAAVAPTIWSHPLVFTGPCGVEIEGRELPGADLLTRCSILIVASFEAGQAIRFVVGGRPKIGSDRPAWFAMNSSIEAVAGNRVTPLASVVDSPWLGEKYHLKATVGSESFTLSCNGRTLAQAKQKHDSRTRISIAVGAFDEITLRGRCDPAWLEGIADAATREQERAWLRDHDPSAELPEWLRSAPAPDSSAATERELGPNFEPTPEQAKLLETARRFRLLGLTKSAVDLLQKLPADALPAEVRDWEIGLALLARGDEALLKTHLDHVRSRDDRSRVAFLLHGQFLLDVRRLDEAQEYLGRVQKALPHDAGALALLVECHLFAGRLAQARQLLLDARAGGMSAPLVQQLDEIVQKAERGPSFARRTERATTHYAIVSDLDETICAEAGRVMEQSFELDARFFGPVELGERRFSVALFSGRAGYLDYSTSIGSPAPHNTAGIYQPLLKQLLVWNLPDRDEMWRTLRHEACHQYVDRLGWHSPPWFEEGMAQYAALFLRRGITSVETGVIDDTALAVMKSSLAHHTDLDFFVVQSRALFYGGGYRNYAQAWALVHFLKHGGKPVAGIFERLIAALRDHLAERDVLVRAFQDVDLAVLDDDFVAYVRKLK